MIESSMYIGIGFFLGALVSLFFVPTIHNRAVRLTTKRLERDVPESLVDIAPVKDLARAEFAIAVRQMELKFNRVRARTIADARQLAKQGDRINRQKTEICALQVRLAAVDRKFVDTNETLTAPVRSPRIVAIRQPAPYQGDSRLRLERDKQFVSAK